MGKFSFIAEWYETIKFYVLKRSCVSINHQWKRCNIVLYVMVFVLLLHLNAPRNNNATNHKNQPRHHLQAVLEIAE